MNGLFTIIRSVARTLGRKEIKNPYGTFVTGAMMSNFAGLAMGREWVASHYGVSIRKDGVRAIPPAPVLSAEAHSSIFKALSMLGMGRNSLKPVPKLDGNREAIDVKALEFSLQELNGAPAIIAANAGTVNTLDFDDFQAIAALKEKYQFWLYVDAAFGGFARSDCFHLQYSCAFPELSSFVLPVRKANRISA